MVNISKKLLPLEVPIYQQQLIEIIICILYFNDLDISIVTYN